MYWQSPWQKVLEIVIRNLFWKAYQKEVFPRKVEIELDLNYFEQNQFLSNKLIRFCLDIGWETAELIEIKKKSLSLVLEKRVQKRCPSG